MKSNLFILFLFLFISCDEAEKDYRLDYGKDLNIDFPKEMILFEMKSESRGQDFENTSYYALSPEQTEEIINQIIVCDSVNNINCWKESDNIYQIYIAKMDIILVLYSYLEILIINEVKI